jgi:hypothetical protein
MSEREDRLLEDYLDGELPDEARRELEARLRSDLTLRLRLGELEGVHQALKSVPTSGQVPDRVWTAIQARIAETPQEEIVDIRSLASDPTAPARSGGSSRRVRPAHVPGLARRFSFSIGQLAAAATILVALGSTLTWAVASRGSGMVPGISADGGNVIAASTVTTPGEAIYAEYEETASQLLEILEVGESVLSEETLQVVRESLAAIDAAVEEALTALDDDPGNEMLNRLLRHNLEKKIDLLRQTAVAVQAVT